MAEMAAKLHDVNPNSAITAIKALRAVTKGSLRWAKMDVYDKVRAGHSISVPVHDMQDIEDLEASGWTVSRDDSAIVEFSARIPAKQMETMTAIAHALGGTT